MTRIMIAPLTCLYILLMALTTASCGEDEGGFVPEPPEEEEEMMVDPNASRITLKFNEMAQTIDHFGASDGWSTEWIGRWPEQSKRPIAELLFSQEMDQLGNPKGIGLSMWRFNVGDGSADQSQSGFAAERWERETECFLQANGTYDWSKQAGSQWFLREARAHGVEKFTGWTTSPPYHMSQSGYTFRTNASPSWNLAEDRYEDYAKHLATVMKHFEEEGMPIGVISPFNETQYPWKYNVGAAPQSGSYATNREVAAFTRILNDELEAVDSDAQILIPESANLTHVYGGSGATSNQAFNFFNASSSNRIGNLSHVMPTVAAHSYFTNGSLENAIDHRKSLRDRLRSQGQLGYWQTEYSILGGDYQEGRDPATLEPMDYALWLARVVHNDVVHGNASGWSFWTALSSSNFADHQYRFNFIRWTPNVNEPTQTDGTYVEVKNLWAFGNFSRFVRPGMMRIETSDSKFSNDVEAGRNFMVSAYVEPGGDRVVLVCINMMEGNHPLHLEGYGERFNFEEDKVTAYITSADRDLRKSSFAVNDIKIPAKSVVTLIANLR